MMKAGKYSVLASNAAWLPEVERYLEDLKHLM